MNCPLCEHELPPLTALLADTQVGTQCPACKTRLRSLKEPLQFVPRAEAEPAAPPRRRAA